ncbi:hypothetical protein IJ380_03130 [Candidatus Saccharibacteria bacterium]|nr:hypothetical protein [Candidatus Saccharibacteria bacterium]
MNTNNDNGGEKDIQELVAWMVKEKGISEEERKIEEGKLREELEVKVQQAIIHELPVESLKEMNELLDREDFSEEEFDDIIEKSGIKTDEVAKKVLDEFAKEYLGETEEAEEE